MANPAPSNLFVSETAAEYGRKGRKVQMALNSARLPDSRQIRARLIQIERAMRDSPNSQVWDQLSRAYERMFRVYCHMVNIPAPGSRRPAPEPKQRRKGAEELDPTAASPVDLLRETE